MYFNVTLHSLLFSLLTAPAILLSAGSARAQLTDVVVGITPNCPYGFPGCWPLAREALGSLDDILIASETPDSYNCTARVGLKHGGLPDLAKMQKRFNDKVGTAHTFRGIEVTIMASVVKKDGQLILQTPSVKQEIMLAPLQNKLQWNFKKRAPRQPEPDEQKAYEELAAKKDKAEGDDFQVEITGPLRQADQGIVMEVREWFPLLPEKPKR